LIPVKKGDGVVIHRYNDAGNPGNACSKFLSGLIYVQTAKKPGIRRELATADLV